MASDPAAMTPLLYQFSMQRDGVDQERHFYDYSLALFRCDLRDLNVEEEAGCLFLWSLWSSDYIRIRESRCMTWLEAHITSRITEAVRIVYKPGSECDQSFRNDRFSLYTVSLPSVYRVTNVLVNYNTLYYLTFRSLMGNQLTILSTRKGNVSCQPMTRNRWEDPWDARSEWSSGATDGSEESLHCFDDLRIQPDKAAISKNKQSPGAHIPPELFDNVLFYVNVHRALQARDGGLSRGSGRPSSYDALTDLKRCSLVCRFWANRCRQYMFAGRTLEIYRFEDAEIFRRYAIGGCAALIPVHQLIGEIHVYLRYDGLINSFLHLLYLSVIRQKLRLLSIHGPIPTGFHPAKLDTPHWGSPPSVVLPRSFLRNQIRVSHIHLPSISHVSKYLRHLICAADIILHLVTWDGEMPISLPGASNAVYRRRKPLSMKISASHCTDNINLALTAAMLNPGCPLHRLSDQDRVWITSFLRLSWTSKRVPRVHIAFDVLEQEATIEMYYPGSFGLILNDAPVTDTDRPATHLRVVGIHAYINISVLPIQFDTLFDRIRTRPTISTAVILFESLYCMKTVIQRYPDLFRPDAEYVRLVLAYADWEQYRAVGIELTTMKPNGVRWTDLPCDDWRSDACDTGHIWSTRILQQQMRK